MPVHTPEGTRVLVAEDDQGLAALLSKGLRRHAIESTVVDTVDDTVAAAASGRFAVLVLDLNQPSRAASSFGVLDRLRPAADQLPVVVLDGRYGPRDHAAAVAAGATAYLPIPFRVADLVATIHLVTGRRDP